MEEIAGEVRLLEAMDLQELREEWHRRWRKPPAFRSADLLRRMLAWRIQIEAFGDLDLDMKRALNRPAARSGRKVELTPGTRISREWKGVHLEVEVTTSGFCYEGLAYRSLSKVAGVITGTKWNGPRFFGLVEKTART